MTNERQCSDSACNAESCANCSKKAESFLAPPNPMSSVKKVIGIVSGKGGVGKSLVTSLLACAMNRRKFTVGILDADITGPSIPKAFGLDADVLQDSVGMIPPKTKEGIAVMSINLMLDDKTKPVIWRGPVVAGTVKQFWTDTVWYADYLFVDMPPGTGDVPLTVFQSLPLDGIIIVTSPQELVAMIVAKAVNMAKRLNVPILGIAENMAYFTCPDCNKKHFIFGESHAKETAAANNIKTAVSLPINPAIAAACDKGLIESIEMKEIEPLCDLLEKL
jgi:Mrp family chromosome partitioning ATPase